MKKKIILLSIISLGYITSCKDFVSQDDVSPNEPSVATLNTLLPVVEIAIYSTHTGSIARNSSMFVQHTAGVQFQSNDYNRYIITETDITNDWQTLYNSGLVNCNQLILQAGTVNPRYAGIAQVSKAMLLGIATDFWGDVPNTTAGLGQQNLTPAYDKQQDVIAAIQTLLSEGIANLKQPDDKNANLPSSDDYLFGGDAASWIKSAYILKARYANRISKRDPNSASLALQFVDSAKVYSSGSDMYAKFSSAANELNPWFSFNDQRADYMKMSATLVDTMAGLIDPRLQKYAGEDPNGSISGAPNGSIGTDFSYVGSAYASDNSPLPLVTMFEAYFIEAEAALRSGDEARAISAFNNGITENMGKLGIGETETSNYLNTSANLTLAPDKQSMIMFQKWIAMFTQAEVWADWRRTGLPALTPNPEGAISQIPRRYPTEQRERNNNPNSTVVSDLITRMWWDQP